MKQLTDEQIARAWASVPDPLALTFKNKQHVLDFANTVIAEFCRINNITGEAQPTEQAKGLEAFGTFVERNDGTTEFRRAGEAHSPTAQGYKFWTLYTTPPAQPALEWVDMTEKELWLAIDGCANKYEACRVIMSRLREKNAGLPAAIKPWPIMPTVKDRGTNRELPVVGVYEDVVFVDVPAADDKAGGECQWQKRNQTETNGVWENTTEGDASWWRNHSTGWEIRKLYTHPQPQAEVRVPDGYVLVPVEPTDDMLRAIRNQRSSGRIGKGDRADWAAWLAAAPQPQEPQQ